MQHFSVLPMEQTIISADGILLEDDNKSLIELGIKSGAHLVLEVSHICICNVILGFLYY